MHIIASVNITAEAGAITRAQSAAYWDRLGVLRFAGANTLRVTYDPFDLKAAPYPMIEQAATNFIRNNMQTSAAAGEPGTLPANWNEVIPTGCSRQVVGVGTESGIPYIDLRYFGTCSAAGQELKIYPDLPGAEAQLGQSWAASAFVSLAAGSLSGLSLRIGVEERSAAPAALNAPTGAFVPTKSPLCLQRASALHTVASADAVAVAAVLRSPVANNATIDVTLRIGLAQLELDVVSSPIRTSTAAATRSADVLPAGNGLLVSNLSENDADDAALWVSGQAVAKDQYRRRTETHRVYRAMQAVPTTITAAPETDPRDASGNKYWLEWEPTNRWAAFDTTLDTLAVGVGEVAQWVIRPGEITGAAAILSVDAADVRVSMVSASGRVVYRKTKSMLLNTSRRWSDWFFKTRERRTDEVFLDMPYLKTGIICITVTKPGSVPKVGDIKVGRLEDIGETLIEPEVRTLRNSIIARDEYNRLRFNKRPSSKIMSANVYIPANRFDAVARMINKYTDEPCVIIGDDRWSSLILLGYVDDFALVLRDGNDANYNMKAIGVG